MNTSAAVIIEKLKQAKASGDPNSFRALLAEDFTFHTPRFFKPVKDHDHFIAIMTGIFQMLPDFEWTRIWPSEHEIIMEFKGHVNGGKIVAHGIDLFEFNDEGKIHTLSVLLRPMSALEAIAEGEDKLIAELLGQAKV